MMQTSPYMGLDNPAQESETSSPKVVQGQDILVICGHTPIVAKGLFLGPGPDDFADEYCMIPWHQVLHDRTFYVRQAFVDPRDLDATP